VNTTTSRTTDTEAAASPRRERVTRDRIIRTALRIMDEEGLEAVTMRRVGRSLGCEAMSLYNHVQDKEDILDGICEAVLAEFTVPDATTWEEGIRAGAREYRRLLLAHPTVLTLMSERRKPFTNPDSLRAYEFALGAFRSAGLSPDEAVMTFHVFGGFILGFVTMELGLMVGGSDDEDQALAHQEMGRLAASAGLTHLQEALPRFAECDVEAQFEFGLDLLVEGLQARIDA
jgi:AcrR family transcriptional regulator